MKLLHLCDFQHEDVCCILAHTSVYFRSTYKACGHQMDSQEGANAVVAQMFIAHSYIQDETCPLRIWHEHIFQKYCSVKTLNEVILRLMEIRAYRLRVDRARFMTGGGYRLLASANFGELVLGCIEAKFCK